MFVQYLHLKNPLSQYATNKINLVNAFTVGYIKENNYIRTYGFYFAHETKKALSF